MLDTFPNVVFELGAVLYDFGRQPRAAREFFTKYQDRILFGKDTFEPSEFPYYWRVFETTDEYFDYYPRTYHAFWKMYGMGLPDAVLRKLYYQNALRVTPGLPQIRLAASVSAVLRNRRLAKYLVTGGAGFIGSHMVQELLRRGAHVRIADNFSTGLWDNIPTHARVDVIDGDVADEAVAARAVDGLRLRAASGRDPVSATLGGRAPRHTSRQRGRDRRAPGGRP